MTKKKPGAVRGRPKGSGEGFKVLAATKLTEEVAAIVDQEAEARGVERAVVLREIITRWAKRRGAPG